MAVRPVVISVEENPAGSAKLYTVSFRLKDMETGLFTGPSKNIQASTKAEMKDLIRPRLQSYLQAEARRQQLLAVAQAALSELITELGF